MDYMGIILKGVSEPNTRQYLTEYLIREHKKAEDEGYTKDEFFSGCRLAYEELAAELNKNRSFILQNAIFENDEDLKKILKNETVNLRVFTRQKFAGYLNEGDIQYIRSCIVEAMLSGASSEAEAPPAPVATSPEPAPPSGEYPHHRIFMSAKAWDFFQILKTDFVTNELADYSYIFHKMKSDGFIYDDIKQLEFIDWLSDTFNIELNASQLKSFGVSRNDKKEKIYTSIKQGFKQK
jgi:hypothetical protein